MSSFQMLSNMPPTPNVCNHVPENQPHVNHHSECHTRIHSSFLFSSLSGARLHHQTESQGHQPSDTNRSHSPCSPSHARPIFLNCRIPPRAIQASHPIPPPNRAIIMRHIRRLKALRLDTRPPTLVMPRTVQLDPVVNQVPIRPVTRHPQPTHGVHMAAPIQVQHAPLPLWREPGVVRLRGVDVVDAHVQARVGARGVDEVAVVLPLRVGDLPDDLRQPRSRLVAQRVEPEVGPAVVAAARLVRLGDAAPAALAELVVPGQLAVVVVAGDGGLPGHAAEGEEGRGEEAGDGVVDGVDEEGFFAVGHPVRYGRLEEVDCLVQAAGVGGRAAVEVAGFADAGEVGEGVG
ncbi:hypothetical protein GE09DRAFT_166476 [Coniochaeta sp. 2T2.1]|nr:hypothetical protein GE09DRAFT_166476 [Coniochaeta sp. 2T2.1]